MNREGAGLGRFLGGCFAGKSVVGPAGISVSAWRLVPEGRRVCVSLGGGTGAGSGFLVDELASGRSGLCESGLCEAASSFGVMSTGGGGGAISTSFLCAGGAWVDTSGREK